MATYVPLVGYNLLVSFVDAGAAAVTKSASQEGRQGRNRFAAGITADPGAVANETLLTLTLNSPLSSALSSDADLYTPVLSICPASQTAAALTPAVALAAQSAVTVAGQAILRQVFQITFASGGLAGSNSFYLNIDWGYTASN